MWSNCRQYNGAGSHWDKLAIKCKEVVDKQLQDLGLNGSFP